MASNEEERGDGQEASSADGSSDFEAPSATTEPPRPRTPWTFLRLSVTLALLCYWSLAFVATHTPAGVRGVRPRFPHFDKVAHFTLYFGLGFLLCWFLTLGHRAYRTAAWITMAALCVYAILDELLQELVPRRTADVLDWTADMIGGLAGIALFGLLWNWFGDRRKTK